MVAAPWCTCPSERWGYVNEPTMFEAQRWGDQLLQQANQVTCDSFSSPCSAEVCYRRQSMLYKDLLLQSMQCRDLLLQSMLCRDLLRQSMLCRELLQQSLPCRDVLLQNLQCREQLQSMQQQRDLPRRCRRSRRRGPTLILTQPSLWSGCGKAGLD